MPSVDCLAYFFGWMRFRDRYELDVICRTTGFRSGLRDLPTNARKIFSNAHQLPL
jgi:hypothetical protein